MSRVRFALLSNALFSAITGLVASTAPERVATWLGSVPAGEVRVVGLSLLVFAVVVGLVARAERPAAASVLAISAADLVWVAGTAPVLVLFPAHFSTLGHLLMIGLAVLVAGFAMLQLGGLARQYAHPDREGEYSHRVYFDTPVAPSPEAMWAVVGDLGSIADHSPSLRSSTLEGGTDPGPGVVRRCVDRRGNSWTELCTGWEPGRSLTLRFDAEAPDFPFPFRSMTGGWIIEPRGEGSTIRVWWDLVPKARLGGGLLVAAMAASLAPSIRRLVATMASAARAGPADTLVRSRPNLHSLSSWLVLVLLGAACHGSDALSSTEPAGSASSTTDDDPTPTTATSPSDGPAVTEFRGLTIAYEAYGHGEPAIVFIHGGISTREVWDEAMSSWRTRRRVVALDLPGHGESASPVQYDRAVFEGSVLAAMDAAQIEAAVVVGHSFGVSVARDVAVAAPDRVAGILMLDGFVVPLGGSAAIGDAVVEPFRGDAWKDAAETFVEQFMLGENTPTDVAELVRDMMLSGSQEQWLGIMELAIDEQIERDDVVDVPVLGTFLPGLTLPVGYEEYLRDRFTGLEFELQPAGTGHFIMLERPEAFATSLDALMERVGS